MWLKMAKIDQLVNQLGIRFSKLDNLKLALTHSSYSNEKKEFSFGK